MPQIIWRTYGIWFAGCLSFRGLTGGWLEDIFQHPGRSLLTPAFQRSKYLTSGRRLLLARSVLTHGLCY